MVHLYDYQKLAVKHILRRIQNGDLRIYATLPTGTGKGVILAAVAARRLCHGRVLVLVHRQDIAVQLVKTLKHTELEVGLLMQSHRDIAAPVIVATTQSLLPSTLDALIQTSEQPIVTIQIDEAHHAVKNSAYERIITTIVQASDQLQIPVIGYTATPYRNDKQSMLSLLPTCAFARDIPDMVRAGRLAPLTWEPVRVDIDLNRIAVSNRDGDGDYQEEELAQELIRKAIIEAIVRQVAAKIGKRPTLVFSVTVNHAELLATSFRQLGFNSAVVSGSVHRNERERIFAEWRAGMIQVVCNCNLLTEGFDYPALSALVIARPTRSLLLYLQMLGRGTRLAPGKQDCLVLDVLGNHPDTSDQIILPKVVGVQKEASLATTSDAPPASASRNLIDPLLKALLGTDAEPGLSLLDPIGQSHYRWTAYRNGYFTFFSRHEAAIIERDPQGSGLYRSRLYTMLPGQPAIHRWIAQQYLPLRQQVALVHDATSSLFVEVLSSKEAPWLEEPASDKQLATLRRLSPILACQAVTQRWSKRMASDAIRFWLLRRTLYDPPSS